MRIHVDENYQNKEMNKAHQEQCWKKAKKKGVSVGFRVLTLGRNSKKRKHSTNFWNKLSSKLILRYKKQGYLSLLEAEGLVLYSLLFSSSGHAEHIRQCLHSPGWIWNCGVIFPHLNFLFFHSLYLSCVWLNSKRLEPEVLCWLRA